MIQTLCTSLFRVLLVKSAHVQARELFKNNEQSARFEYLDDPRRVLLILFLRSAVHYCTVLKGA